MAAIIDNVTFKWLRFESISVKELHEIIMAREAVFVVEQKCAYQETDMFDLSSWHLLCRVGERLAGYARVIAPGLKYLQPSIGRVMITAFYRSHKLGRRLMLEAIRFTEQTYPGQGIQIGAQAHLHGFYSSLGFQRLGEVYDDDGIPHIDMVKAPDELS